jgi:hypothetical protein
MRTAEASQGLSLEREKQLGPSSVVLCGSAPLGEGKFLANKTL